MLCDLCGCFSYLGEWRLASKPKVRLLKIQDWCWKSGITWQSPIPATLLKIVARIRASCQSGAVGKWVSPRPDLSRIRLTWSVGWHGWAAIDIDQASSAVLAPTYHAHIPVKSVALGDACGTTSLRLWRSSTLDSTELPYNYCLKPLSLGPFSPGLEALLSILFLSSP